MNSFVSHIQLNIKKENNDFYKEFLLKMGFEILMEFDLGIGYKNNIDKTSIWIMFTAKQGNQDYDLTGVNHIGFFADSISDVDNIAEWLKTKDIKALFDTPRHRPEFSDSEDSTYYQVMFETPDRVLFEVVYTGKK